MIIALEVCLRPRGQSAANSFEQIANQLARSESSAKNLKISSLILRKLEFSDSHFPLSAAGAINFFSKTGVCIHGPNYDN